MSTRTYGTTDMSRALGGVSLPYLSKALSDGSLPEPERRQPRIEWRQESYDAVIRAIKAVSIPVSRILADTTPRSAVALSAVVPVMPGSIRKLAAMGLLPAADAWAPADLVPILDDMRRHRMIRLVTIRGVDHVAPYVIMTHLRNGINHDTL